MVGLEPTRYHYRQILSLVRLPVPPHPQVKPLAYIIIKKYIMQAVFLNLFNKITFFLVQDMLLQRYQHLPLP